MIGIIIYINIMQRSKEIGVMKAVGYQNPAMSKEFYLRGYLIVGIALLLGIFWLHKGWEVWRMRL